MIRTGQSRFISDSIAIEKLTGAPSLPAKLTPSLCTKLGLPQDIVLSSMVKVSTKGVGSTQCLPYILHFNNGEKIFLKVSPQMKNAVKEQAKADANILMIMQIADPFILMIPDAATIASEKVTKINSPGYTTTTKINELLFFPYVSGQNLFMTTETYKDSVSHNRAFNAIGIALAKMHIICMKQTNTYEDFLKNGCRLPPVLVHDDWQSTNIMIDELFNAKFIDTEGTEMSSKSYRNILETWEMCQQDVELMQSFLTGYMSLFPLEKEAQLKEVLSQELLAVKCVDIFNTALKSESKKDNKPTFY